MPLQKVDKKYTGCNLKTTELIDCALIGVCAVIRSNMALRVNTVPSIFTLSLGTLYLLTILVLKFEIVHSTTS